MSELTLSIHKQPTSKLSISTDFKDQEIFLILEDGVYSQITALISLAAFSSKTLNLVSVNIEPRFHRIC